MVTYLELVQLFSLLPIPRVWQADGRHLPILANFPLPTDLVKPLHYFNIRLTSPLSLLCMSCFCVPKESFWVIESVSSNRINACDLVNCLFVWMIYCFGSHCLTTRRWPYQSLLGLVAQLMKRTLYRPWVHQDKCLLPKPKIQITEKREFHLVQFHHRFDRVSLTMSRNWISINVIKLLQADSFCSA